MVAKIICLLADFESRSNFAELDWSSHGLEFPFRVQFLNHYGHTICLLSRLFEGGIIAHWLTLLLHQQRSHTEYYVITPKNLRPLKAVLKGLPVSYNADEISTGLAELGLQIDEVRQLTNLKTRALIPVWQLVYKKSE
ncbi:hypothetical protein CEXT_450111 [Caerostris extrusa]|uniref:MutS-like protein n=1 Tax=Caerostris extrusa TaxID=172846 RepID=A0AAV4XQ02_CAEEX|nr:hypothetical protein CEXT_450111 [Caerostris extrusa]